MKKLLLALIIILTLSGCGPKTDGYDEETDLNLEQPITYLVLEDGTYKMYSNCIGTYKYQTEYAYRECETVSYLYTQEQVDKLVEELREQAQGGDILLAQGLDDLQDENIMLKQRIEELENNQDIVVYSNCNIEYLIDDVFVSLYETTTRGYTFQYDDEGNLLMFYENGEYKETLTEEDIIAQYCEVESEE